MELKVVLELLGMPIINKELLNSFSNFGINLLHELNLPDGEYRAYIERHNKGISFIFTDESMYLNFDEQSIGEGTLYFSGIFLYADGEDGYREFKGNMPMVLSFIKTRDEIVKYIGESSWKRKRQDGSIAADRWDNIEQLKFKIHITYSKTTNCPAVILLYKEGVPI